jgi:hypothetical protein
VIIVADSFYRSQDMVAAFQNVPCKTPPGPENEKIRLKTVMEKLTHLAVRQNRVVSTGTGCDGSHLESMGA